MGQLEEILYDRCLNSRWNYVPGSISSSHTLSNICLYKSGTVVMLVVSIKLTANVAAYETVATIPSGFRPFRQMWGIDNLSHPYTVTQNGNIQSTVARSSGEYITIVKTYLVEG